MWPFEPPYPEGKLPDMAGSEYDYIIVGGGTAGCALASRLSEDPDVTVLVVEKGPIVDNWFTRTPLPSCTVDPRPGTVLRDSAANRECLDRRALYCHSESLGGCSNFNGMLYIRGLPAAYDESGLAHRLPAWSWDQVEPYFHKVEDVRGLGAPRSGLPGAVQISQLDAVFELSGYVKSSAAALGLPTESLMNSPDAPTAGPFAFDHTIDSNGERHSVFRAYLPKKLAIERQARLTVCTRAVTTGLELDMQRRRVTGVHARHVKTAESVLLRARREVIVCCGALGTPQLLQLSGIGPASLLNKHDIPVRRDMPHVGQHLSHHFGIPICMELPPSQTVNLLETSKLQVLWHFLRYFANRTGWMSSPAVHAAIFFNTSQLDPGSSAFLQTDSDAPRQDAADKTPDVEVLIVPANSDVGCHKGVSLASLNSCLVQPRSEGSIEINCKDAEADPTIFSNMLSDPRDFEVARKALRFSLKLAEHFMHESGYPHPAKLFLAPERDSEQAEPTDAQLDDFARAKIRSMWHLGCSCRMGKEEHGGVVDGELRVHGFENLRIADASVFPIIPPGHTMAPTYMVAERCADLVKEARRAKARPEDEAA